MVFPVTMLSDYFRLHTKFHIQYFTIHSRRRQGDVLCVIYIFLEIQIFIANTAINTAYIYISLFFVVFCLSHQLLFYKAFAILSLKGNINGFPLTSRAKIQLC